MCRIRVRLLLQLFVLTFLSACNFPGALRSLPDLQPAATKTASPTPTATIAYEQCYFNWATQPLPELSAQVQAALDAAGLTDVTARAEAYGENCYDSQTNEVAYFAAMETDFRVTIKVPDLKDTESLGNLLEKVLIVLDDFPTDKTPGPQPGYIGVTFQAGNEVLNMWFKVSQGIQARRQGYDDAALLQELLPK